MKVNCLFVVSLSIRSTLKRLRTNLNHYSLFLILYNWINVEFNKFSVVIVMYINLVVVFKFIHNHNSLTIQYMNKELRKDISLKVVYLLFSYENINTVSLVIIEGIQEFKILGSNYLMWFFFCFKMN